MVGVVFRLEFRVCAVRYEYLVGKGKSYQPEAKVPMGSIGRVIRGMGMAPVAKV